MLHKSLSEYYERYHADEVGFLDNHVSELIPRFSELSREDILWLTDSLRDNTRKWFVASVFNHLSLTLPEDLFVPMLRAAVYEIDPSFNRAFVEPCLKAFGHRRVNETLLEYVENGTDFEKAGAVNALYWARLGLTWQGRPPAWTKEYATPESVAAYEALSDVRIRQKSVFLREFVSNSNVEVRRSLIPFLNLDPSSYPDELKPLVAQAIEIARNHEDDYIRHRVEVQLGTERILKPLPHRRAGKAED